MDHLKLAFQNAAEWRRVVASEYPDDKRNGAAAAELERLAETVADVGGERAEAYEALWDCDRDGHRATEIEQEMLRSTGFGGYWTTAGDFIADLLERIER